jgi:hypothetical protein
MGQMGRFILASCKSRPWVLGPLFLVYNGGLVPVRLLPHCSRAVPFNSRNSSVPLRGTQE